jgi:SAM-dependent methyltransferase
LAAAGAIVTVFDNSPMQLKQDQTVSDAHGLGITTVEGDMADLSFFEDERFDLIFHPVSNCFCENIVPVWREAWRVLKPGGRLLAGFCNPVFYLFDVKKMDAGELLVRFTLPYSDLTSITETQRVEAVGADQPLEFGHTLEQQIGGQIAAGFSIHGFYEDSFGGELILDRYTPCFIATLAIKSR